MADDDRPPTPPRSCPICRVTMQATETDERIVHQCHNCGMTITMVLPDAKDE